MAPGTDMAVGFYIPAHITSCDATFVKFVTCLCISCGLVLSFLKIFLTPTILGKASVVKIRFRWVQRKCPTKPTIIDSDIVIAKDLPLISVLMLLLQKSLP